MVNLMDLPQEVHETLVGGVAVHRARRGCARVRDEQSAERAGWEVGGVRLRCAVAPGEATRHGYHAV